MGVSVTNGFNVGAGATNPGFFDSDSFQIANDTDVLRGRHQFSFGANWIRTKIETLNNRPSNGQFTFNGQTTGLGLADFMLGRMSNFLQGNPVYDFDENDYVGAYVQDEWKIAREPDRERRSAMGALHSDQELARLQQQLRQGRFDQGIRSRVYTQAPPGLYFPGDDGFPGNAVMNSKLAQFAPRLGLVWTPDEATAFRVGLGHFLRHAAPVLQHALRQQSAVGCADHAHESGGRVRRSLSRPIRVAIRSRRWLTGWQTQPFPAFGVYVNAPLDTEPTALHQWNIGAQRQFGDWLVSASYLGNRSNHLWRATELNPAVFSPGATTATTNQRRVLFRQDPVQGQFYGTIGQLDDSGESHYHGMLLSLQRRLKNNLSVLSNYTLSKCSSDPATTELTGPTIVDPSNPDLDYSYCDSDRRHVVNVSVVRAHAAILQSDDAGAV